MDFEPVGAEVPRVGEPPAIRGERIEAELRDHILARADRERRAIPEQAIDQIGREKGGGGPRPAFDEQVIDTGQIGDRGRRIELARLCPARRRARLFLEAVQGIWARGVAVRLRRHREAPRRWRAFDLLVSRLPAELTYHA